MKNEILHTQTLQLYKKTKEKNKFFANKLKLS